MKNEKSIPEILLEFVDLLKVIIPNFKGFNNFFHNKEKDNQEKYLSDEAHQIGFIHQVVVVLSTIPKESRSRKMKRIILHLEKLKGEYILFLRKKLPLDKECIKNILLCLEGMLQKETEKVKKVKEFALTG